MAEKKDYAAIAYSFCIEASNDALPNRKTSKLERLAYIRHLRDLDKQNDEDFPFYFDEKAANKRCAFTEKLPHTKGKWRNQLIVLEPHQIFAQCCVFGWKYKETGNRRFNKVYECIPRKNGKSAEAATTGLFMAFADGEQTAEVYAGATTEKQAMMVFEPAWQMCKINADLSEYYNITRAGTEKNPTSVFNIEDMSRFEPIVGKPGDGASPHCAIVDEYHEHPTSVLYDAMDTGMGARDQPLLMVITTAGSDTSSPCYELHCEAVKVLEGTLLKENLFVLIFGIDDEDDWQDFEAWKKANPNFGVSINEVYLKGKYNDALTNVSQRNILLTKHLNKWMNSGSLCFDMIKWGINKNVNLKIENFYGCECWVGVDLASKLDLCAVMFLFKIPSTPITVCPKCGSKVLFVDDKFTCQSKDEEKPCSWSRRKSFKVAVFGKYYLPEETVNKKENQHYQTWRDKGILTVTEGARTDFQKVEDDLEEISKLVVIKELTFDPKEASYLIQNIESWSNFECVEFTQSPSLISEPMKEAEAMIVDGSMIHDGDELLAWSMGNVIKKQARSGGATKHYFPTKQNAASKIDPAVAIICALGRLMTNDEDNGDPYNSRAARGEEEILRVL